MSISKQSWSLYNIYKVKVKIKHKIKLFFKIAKGISFLKFTILLLFAFIFNICIDECKNALYIKMKETNGLILWYQRIFHCYVNQYSQFFAIKSLCNEVRFDHWLHLSQLRETEDSSLDPQRHNFDALKNIVLNKQFFNIKKATFIEHERILNKFLK